jgi:membrane protein DedA with SNARE-associated domain
VPDLWLEVSQLSGRLPKFVEDMLSSCHLATIWPSSVGEYRRALAGALSALLAIETSILTRRRTLSRSSGWSIRGCRVSACRPRYHARVLGLLNPTSFVESSGYVAIFILCVAQSCCIPTSSELTMGIAGVLAATGKLNLAAVILIGAFGELVGAYIAWFIGRTAGRGFVDRLGKYLLLTHRDLDRAEAWYQRHERWGVFGSRLVPLVRNFVAVPAGVAEVPLVRFGLLTAAGSLVWDGAMAGIGYAVGTQYTSIMHGFSDAGYVIGALVVLAIAFVIFHRYRSYRAETARVAAGGERSGEVAPPARPPVRGSSGVRVIRKETVQTGSLESEAVPREPPD